MCCCILRTTPTTGCAPLVSIKTTQPLELVSIDYLTLEVSRGGFQHILVITDHFTRYAQAIPTRNQNAKTTAAALLDNFVFHYGVPTRLHSDQGATFESAEIQELCRLLGTKKSRTTSYAPWANGMTERMNRTLLAMLGTLDAEKKKDWRADVAPLVHAYNATKHDSTGQSPFFLMFCRQPRLPIDVALGLPNLHEGKSLPTYINELRERLHESYQKATEEADKARAGQKLSYDRRARAGLLEVGDRVLVKILAFEGKHKLSNKWEDRPYVVLEHSNPEMPVYVVRREDGIGRTRTLHRNHLFPVSDLPFLDHNDLELERSTTAQKKKRVQPNTLKDTPELDSTSSYEDDLAGYGEIVEVFVPPAPQPVEPLVEPGDETLLPPPEFEETSDSERDSSQEEAVEDADILLVLPPPPPVHLEVPDPQPVLPPSPPQQLRSSRRNAGLPPRFADFYVNQLSNIEPSSHHKEWRCRADYLLGLVTEHGIDKMPEHISQAFVKIVLTM